VVFLDTPGFDCLSMEVGGHDFNTLSMGASKVMELVKECLKHL
jgi:hypothetical protein